jgi:hypothetical protein
VTIGGLSDEAANIASNLLENDLTSEDIKQIKTVQKRNPSHAQPQSEESAEATVLEVAKARMNVVIKDSSEARSWGIKLRPFDVSTQIASQMMAHHEYLEKTYGVLSKLVQNNVSDAKTYHDIFAKLDKAAEWYQIFPTMCHRPEH